MLELFLWLNTMVELKSNYGSSFSSRRDKIVLIIIFLCNLFHIFSDAKSFLSPKQVSNLVSRTPSINKGTRPAPVPVRRREDSEQSQATSPLASPTRIDKPQDIRPEPAPRSTTATSSVSMPALSQRPPQQPEAKSPTETRRGLVPSKSDMWQDTEAKPRDPLKRNKPKRTLSLKTHRTSASFKDKYRLPNDLPPAEMEGFLERKQELQSGGKKATIRSWKTFYTVLCGQLLCFFKDRQGMFKLSGLYNILSVLFM